VSTSTNALPTAVYEFGDFRLDAEKRLLWRGKTQVPLTILEGILRDQPGYAYTWSLLGRVEAALGNKEEAIKAGRRACELMPLSSEPTSGLRPLKDLARIYTAVGEKDLALEILGAYAGQPLFPDYGHLKLEPDWDPLRDDPRFEKIVASLAPK
jgi:serine/threonine-protein kinase